MLAQFKILSMELQRAWLRCPSGTVTNAATLCRSRRPPGKPTAKLSRSPFPDSIGSRGTGYPYTKYLTMFVSRAGKLTPIFKRPFLQRCTYHSQAPAQASQFLKISDEVQEAIASARPIVALETTIYTHGKFNPVQSEHQLR